MDSTSSDPLKAYSLELSILIAAILISASIFLAVGNLANSGFSSGTVSSSGSGSDLQFSSIDISPLQLSSRTGSIRGSPTAKVSVVEFSDFQCPYCQRAHPTIQSMLSDQSGRVKLVYRHYNAANHPYANKAGEAYECAIDQNKGWEYHDKLFEVSPDLDVVKLKEYARAVGLDGSRFDSCLDGGQKASIFQRDQQLAAQYRIGGTPGFLLIGGDVNRIDKEVLSSFKATLEQAGGEALFFKTNDNKVVVKFSGALPYQYWKPVLDAQVAAS